MTDGTPTEITEPVIGFRKWRVNGRGTLAGLGYGTTWPGARLTAECLGTSTFTKYTGTGQPNFVELMRELSRYRRIMGPDYDINEYNRTHPDQYIEKRSCVPPETQAFDHPIPSLNSMCGIWSHKTPVPECPCGDPTNGYHRVVGVIRMWGRAVEHETGWRAEHAEIAGLWDPTGTVSLERYPVRRHASLTDMYVEWAPDFDPERDGWADAGEHYCTRLSSKAMAVQMFGPNATDEQIQRISDVQGYTTVMRANPITGNVQNYIVDRAGNVVYRL